MTFRLSWTRAKNKICLYYQTLFFQAEEGTGEEVSTEIARITEKALRGPKSKKDDEKLHELKQKHKQPINIQFRELKNFFGDSGMLFMLLTPHIFLCYIKTKSLSI